MGSFDCSTQGDLTTAAATMDDLATLIEDTGIENLQDQIGVDLSFAFDFNPLLDFFVFLQISIENHCLFTKPKMN